MNTTINTSSNIEFTRINNDVNGNPRYVCHYLNLLSSQDQKDINTAYFNNSVSCQYAAAIQKANKIGGKKYHTKQYGGGIVFQSYNIDDTARKIKELVNA